MGVLVDNPLLIVLDVLARVDEFPCYPVSKGVECLIKFRFDEFD